MKKTSLLAGLIGLFLYLPATAEVKFTGYLEAELRHYPSEGLIEDQEDTMASVAAEPELALKSDNESHGFRIKLFGRYSDPDGNRDHADVRELYYNYAGSGWQIEVGANKVYWGVVESLHLVDIINQTDSVESVNGEEKLGQPLLSLGLEQSWGNLDLYVLPYFRERKFNQGPERFQISLNGQILEIDEDAVFYEDDDEEKHVDYAARWGSYFGNLDIGITAFSGTNRDPLLVLSKANLATMAPEKFGSYYEQLDQLGIAMQYLYEEWAFKYEGITRQLESGDYNAGVIGFEFTLSDLEPWGYDLGLLLEYLWNDRSDVSIKEYSYTAMGVTENDLIGLLNLQNATPEEIAQILAQLEQQSTIPGNYLSPFENDIFFGTRFTLNDVGSTQFLAGFIVDADDQTTSASFEGSTRIGDSVRVTLNIYLFEHVKETSAFYPLRRDDQIEAKVAWYF